MICWTLNKSKGKGLNKQKFMLIQNAIRISSSYKIVQATEDYKWYKITDSTNTQSSPSEIKITTGI